MNSEGQNICPNCQYRTVEFVIAFSGSNRVTSGDVCGLDLPGYSEKSNCIGYEPKSRNRASLPSVARYPVGNTSIEISALNA